MTDHHLLCSLGKHHYETVQDDNPEIRGGSHRKCTKCGHIQEGDGGGQVVARWGVEK